MKFLSVFTLAFIFIGCSSHVKPWEKEQLSKSIMQIDNENSLSLGFVNHMYISKEAVRGGERAGGGGCGCR